MLILNTSIKRNLPATEKVLVPCGSIIISFQSKNTDVFETGIIALNLCLEILARSIPLFFFLIISKENGFQVLIQ